MPIPTYDKLLHPVLKLATQQDITRRSATEAMIQQFGLTEEEASAVLPSGNKSYISNRTGWAMTFLTKGGLIRNVAKFTYHASEAGIEFLRRHPHEITGQDLETIDGWEEAWKSTRKRKNPLEAAAVVKLTEDKATPDESISQAVIDLEESLRSNLLEQLVRVDPYRFEQIVLDLLFAMGYGGSREEAARATRKSNDEGIDGVINEDRLGLDAIYVQAKRWQATVGRKEIQSFVGALAGQQANKGVFITTSDFASTALEYARAVSQKVVLIDGARLADLMIEHNIGVSIVRTIAIKRLDSDYFEEE